VVAVISRLVMTIGDVAWAALASAFGRVRRPRDAQEQASPARDPTRLA
jgi:hypothetical protein